MVLLSVVLLVFSGILVAQDYSFSTPNKHTKSPENVIHFKVLGIQSDEKAESVTNDLIQHRAIVNAVIIEHYKCKITINEPISAQEVRNILLNNHTDFFFPSIETSKNELHNNLESFRDIMVPPNMPVHDNYINESDYLKAMEYWQKDNPEKYHKLKELGYIN